MRPARKRKLWLLFSLAVLLSLVLMLVLYALRQNINLFFTPSQIAKGEAHFGQRIRVGGMVVKGSVLRDGLTVQFDITDYHHRLRIAYHGILPDLFREGQGIIAQGQYTQGNLFQATEVLAKHDEKYMPPEVKAMMTEQQRQ